MRQVMAALLLVVVCGCNHNNNTPDPTPVVTAPQAPTVQPVIQPGPGDRAVCIGINKYPGCPLSGCVNDANDVHDFLIKVYGFKPDQIRVLTDGDATCENIKAAAQWLVDGAKAGDRRLFHYSGHGAEDAVLNFQNDPDHLNQMICPVDFDWSPAHEVIDKQFVEIFSKFPPGVLFNWLSDSCHSGDLDKAFPKNGRKSVAKQYPNVPDEVKKRVQAVKAKGIKSRGMVGGKLDVGYVSGCKADQTSADTQDETGRPCGALTNYFLQSMKTLAEKPLSDVVSDVDKNLARDQYDQVPQAEGARTSRPFLK